MYKDKIISGLNLLGVIAIVSVNGLAFFLQWHEGVPPCTLCMLQRLGLLMAGFGLLLNLRYGFKGIHYSVVLVSIIFSMVVASRQILLHIVPGSGAYGHPFLGLHLYTLVWIFSLLFMLYIALLLCFSAQFAPRSRLVSYHRFMPRVCLLVFVLLLGVTVANVVNSIFLV